MSSFGEFVEWLHTWEVYIRYILLVVSIVFLVLGYMAIWVVDYFE